jgi:hypothetical protein
MAETQYLQGFTKIQYFQGTNKVQYYLGNSLLRGFLVREIGNLPFNISVYQYPFNFV